MRTIVIITLTLTLIACAVTPHVPGGQKVSLAGISFIAPPNMTWFVMVESTYQVVLGTKRDNPNETLIVYVSTYQVPTFSKPEDFLAYVKSSRAGEPKTGRFEVMKNDEKLYKERVETCVEHETESKDYGAKRGGKYTVIQYLGMNCIHPSNPAVGILIELSRKSPPGIKYPQFKTLGSNLLKSVEFNAYR